MGFGVYYRQLNLNFSQIYTLVYCSLFKAEIFELKEAVNWPRLSDVSQILDIYTDIHTAFMALDSTSLRTRTSLACHSSLKEVAEQFYIRNRWVPGSRDIFVNIRANELAESTPPSYRLLWT